ncbi:MAG: SpoIID/LytB domain-containing protein [Thermoleophilaceae bacterium]|nr:SpoIID/LytB domain-containing protein [Thermoleophilaceae bacterium]
MRRLLFTAALLSVSVVPTASDAATRHVVRGAGWGHGIGMSQYGAYGYALRGRGHRQILSHYYTDTRMSSAPSRPVRVLLQPDDPYIRVRGATRAGRVSLRPSTTYVASPRGGGIVLSTQRGKRIARFSGSLRFSRPGHPLRLLGPALNGISSGMYRGSIEVLPTGGDVTAINALSIDEYVRGVVAGEMPSSWPLEALKAQAVAARTYALATRKTTGSFDLYPDTRSQVYRGVTGESVRSDSAVAATSGLILTYGGLPAVTFYFSTSGGHTESIQFSFVGALSKPWLVGVVDPYDSASPHHRWQQSFSTAALSRALGAPGKFRRLEVLKRGTSPRIVTARVVGSRGSTTISGPTIRARLDLRDTWMRFTKISTSARHSRSVRSAGLGGSLEPGALTGVFDPAPGEIRGVFDPAPRARRLTLERRVKGRWRRVGLVRTSVSGRYRREIDRAGTYRVRLRTIAGPAVRVG